MANDLSQLFQCAQSGDRKARADLIRRAYDDLRRLARAQMANQRPDHTLTATALVHEVSAKLLQQSQEPSTSRGQFLALAAAAMRNYLIDHARGRARQKRGGGRRPLHLEEACVAAVDQPDQLLELHEALERLAEVDQRRSRVVELRYFGGMSIVETAQVLNTSPATVKRDWQVARIWLFNELKQAGQILDSPSPDPNHVD